MKRDGAVMVALVALGGALAIMFGERIGINQGQGWDGISYTQWAQDFARVLHAGLTRYHAQRVLPSAVVYEALRLAGRSHDIPHVLRAFAVLDVAVLASAAALWASLAATMAWSRAAAWAGFIALFGSFASAKHAVYYPALTDPTAFALGLMMVWAYLTDRPIALWSCAALGVVTWPALPPLALVMLVFPRAELAKAGAGLDRRVAIGLGAVAAAVFVIVGFHYLAHPVPGVGDEKFAAWVPRGLLWVTVPVLVALIVAGIAFALAPVRLRAVLAYARALPRRRTMLALAAAIALMVGRAIYLAAVGTKGEGPTGAQFLCEHTLAALRGPLWGPVAHVVYFGPIIAVAIVCWKRVCAVAWSWGPAAVIALVLVVAFAAGSNSRQWSHLEPLVVAATIAATAAWWTPRRVLAFAVLAFVWSKLWFHLGYATVVDWHSFPNQRYFMNTGPYSADGPYLVHLAAAVLTVAVVWWASRREIRLSGERA
jgi:hypothetical protein